MRRVFLKLITGNYVIGDVKDENEDVLVIEKPLGISFEAMMGGLSAVPYDAYYLGKEVQEVKFKKDHIMHEFEADDIPEELSSKYTEYKSGILVQPEAAPQGSPDISEEEAMEFLKQLQAAGNAGN